MEDMSESKELDDLVNNIVRFVKKSANIQHRLPSTLKSVGKTRPWRSLVDKYQSVINSREALIPILRERKKESLILDGERADLAEEILSVLTVVRDVFDTLEFAYKSTLQNVLPCFYLLHRIWLTEDRNASQVIQHLKMNLVWSIDEKMWVSIKTLQTAATWLDPILKSFTFVDNATDRRRLLSDGERMVLSQSSAAVEHLQRKLEDTIEIKEESVESPPSIKKIQTRSIGAVSQHSSYWNF